MGMHMLRKKEVNKINVFNYVQSHHHDVVQGVIQFLETFNCDCNDLLETLVGIEEERTDGNVKKAERMGTGKISREERAEIRKKKLREIENKMKSERKDLPPLHLATGVCPKCDSVMYGEPQRFCTKIVKGPVFYAECSVCPYYYEMWRNNKTGNSKIVEGSE